MAEQQAQVAEGRTGWRAALPAFVAFACYALSNWMTTNLIFPIGTAAAPYCRDVATLANAVLYFSVALIASHRPRLLSRHVFLVALPVLAVVGAVILAAPAGANPALATLAISLLLFASTAVMLSAGCSLARLDARLLAPCVLVGLALSYLLRFVLADLGGVAALALFVAVQALAVFAGRGDMAATLRTLQSGETPDELTLTNPFSFLPRTHRLFVCLGLFQLAYGVALGFGEVNVTPLATFAGVVPLLCLAVFFLLARRMPRFDTLFGWALLLVMSGFLFTDVSQQVAAPLTSNLLEAGSSCFMLLFWPILATMAARNRTGTLPLFAWSGFLLCIGVTAGAAVGRVCYAVGAQGLVQSASLTAVIVLSMAAYAVFGMRGFSFDATVAGIAQIDEGQQARETSEAVPVSQTAELLEGMANHAGLTAREQEIFLLLAQGRNGGYIQRQLGVSYNTIKTHVAHIYAKFSVHSHQELIDLVEQKAGR